MMKRATGPMFPVLARAFAETLPAHAASLSLTHNPHRAYHMTVGEAIELEVDLDAHTWVSEEEKQKAIATNECWTIQWYPDTPVGFIQLAAHDLGALLQAALAE